MKYNEIKKLLTVICAIACFQAVAQTPPSAVTAFLHESTSTSGGCGDITDCTAGIICFDVGIEINEPGWHLDAYDIWMNYGPDSTLLTYRSDTSCNHVDGGDIDDINSFGKYRFLAAQFQFPIPANVPVILHNFCLDLNTAAGAMMTDLDGLSITAGGPVFGLASNYSLVVPGTQNGVAGFISGSSIVLDENTLSCLQVLPVEYLSFKAEKGDHEVNLIWETATEINNERFEIERSVDGKEFRSIGTIAGNGTTFSTSRYNFIDQAPLEANYYRLRQVDFDGTADYSNIRFAGFDDKGEVAEKVVYPNPFRDELNFDLGAPGLYQLELYNTAGELIQKLNITNNAAIDMSTFAPGVYMFKAYNAEGKEVLVDTVVKLDRS